MKTLIFWDSITEWNSDILESGWATMLRIYMLKNSNNRFVNLGIGWDDVVDLLKRFDCMTKFYIEKYNKKCSFIFAIWINDSVTNIDETKNLYSLADFEQNLEKLISKAKNYNPKNITFIWLTNVDEKLVCPFPWSSTWKCYKNNRIKKFDEVLEKTAIKNNCNYIKIFWILENSDLDDWLHPNNIWHKKMFKKILENLSL